MGRAERCLAASGRHQRLHEALDGAQTGDIDEYQLLETGSWLEDSEFLLDGGELTALTDEFDIGWQDVSGDAGADLLNGYESNFDQTPYEDAFEIETFEDYGLDDLGDAFSGYEMDFDW